MLVTQCVILLAVLSASSAVSSLEECFKNDSITCLQMQVYETAKNYLGKSNIEFSGGGFTLRGRRRRPKSLETADKKIMEADGVEERQRALQEYFIDAVDYLWNEGSLSWNPMGTARSLMGAAFVGEARDKDKKQSQILLPLLIGIMLKMAALSALTYMGITVIAKKAVLAGVVSLVVSSFIAIKNLIEAHHNKQQDFVPYHHAVWEPMNLWQQAAPANPAIYDSGKH